MKPWRNILSWDTRELEIKREGTFFELFDFPKYAPEYVWYFHGDGEGVYGIGVQDIGSRELKDILKEVSQEFELRITHAPIAGIRGCDAIDYLPGAVERSVHVNYLGLVITSQVLPLVGDAFFDVDLSDEEELFEMEEVEPWQPAEGSIGLVDSGQILGEGFEVDLPTAMRDVYNKYLQELQSPPKKRRRTRR